MKSDPANYWALHDPETWNRECEFIERRAEQVRNDGTEGKRDLLIDYCELQRDLAAKRGFHHARVRIQQVVNQLRRDA